jgi:hypothetical protein
MLQTLCSLCKRNDIMREHLKHITHTSKFHYEYFKKFSSSEAVFFSSCIGNLLRVTGNGL